MFFELCIKSGHYLQNTRKRCMDNYIRHFAAFQKLIRGQPFTQQGGYSMLIRLLDLFFKLNGLFIHYNQQTIQKVSKSIGMNTNKFIVKLIEMMREFPEIINWSADGQEIQIFDIQKFSSEVHPKYFTTSNYQSFLRQLNMYNFKKMSKRKNSVSFRHEEFQRDNQMHFQGIKRRQQKFQNKEIDKIERQVQSELQEVNHSSLTTSSSSLQLDNQIRQTISLIKKEISEKGLQFVERLEVMLQKRVFNSLPSTEQLLPSNKSMENFKEYASFYKIDEMLGHKGDFYGAVNSEFNFQSNIFHRSIYFQQ